MGKRRVQKFIEFMTMRIDQTDSPASLPKTKGERIIEKYESDAKALQDQYQIKHDELTAQIEMAQAQQEQMKLEYPERQKELWRQMMDDYTEWARKRMKSGKHIIA